MNTGIYQITNTVNGKIYIGSAVKLKERRHMHRGALNRGEHHNNHLQSAWRKYGSKAFEWRTLLLCSRDDLMFYEQRSIDVFNAVKNGYNKCPIAGKTVGRIPNPEVIKKMSATKRGVPKTPEAKAAHAAAMARPEVRARLSASCKAAIRKPKTAEHIRNAALAQKGKVVSPETRAKLRAANLGKKRGPYKLKQLTRAHRGRPLSATHLANIRLAQQRRRERERIA